MLIIPAIDIKNGNCVRLLQGDPDKETVYSNNPIDMAKKFQDEGAELIHVVDLDGAFQGNPMNFKVVSDIASSISIPIEIGGGIRNIETIEKYLDTGITRIILGTILLDDKIQEFVSKYPDNIIAGIDAKDSIVATHGWQQESKISDLVFIKKLKSIGIKDIIYTDIATDGMLVGPNITSMTRILDEVDGIGLIASGGVSSMEDIVKLSELRDKGLIGCIVGKAIYEGKVELNKALSYFK